MSAFGLADTLRAAVVEALQRRAAAQQGQARQLIEQRIEQLRFERDTATPDLAQREPVPRGAALAGLSGLVDRLGRAPTSGVRSAAPARPSGTPAPAAAPAPLKAVAAFKGTWSRLRAEQRLRQALAQVPAQAGPLNSSHLVHQVLREMHQLSPAYLDAFMVHVDTLLRLEQASGGGARPGRKS
ncbi:MAG: DUF2894 domain-containing protein [Piscinibacter sp.]